MKVIIRLGMRYNTNNAIPNWSGIVRQTIGINNIKGTCDYDSCNRS
ncbi:hypothetical protein [Lucifera butyrica]|nr:hypothetical protein [Lucifera butyrica]